MTYAFELRIGALMKRGLIRVKSLSLYLNSELVKFLKPASVAVFKYSEGALELASQFWAKSFLQSTTLQGLEESGA
jgi:hypothetical protein